MITKALIYCRVSSIRQVMDGHGLDSQELRCRNFAISKGYVVEKVFPDEGVSGGLFERPAMKALIAYLDNHPLEKYAIVFDDLSRFARDMKVHIQLRTELRSRGVKLECLNFNFEDSPESEYAELILAAGNQYQRQQNRRQVINRMKARIEKGYWSFCNPPGFKYIKDPIHGKLLIRHDPYATIFRTAIEMFGRDLLITQDDVQNFINQEYLKNGIQRKISHAGTYEILTNILYAGYIEYLPWDIPRMKAQHKGFISYETYLNVQGKIAKRTKVRIRKDTSKDFPLRRLITCFDCDRPLSGSWNKGRTNYYPNYFCITKGCPSRYKSISKNILEPQFKDLLEKNTPPQQVYSLVQSVLEDVWQNKHNEYSKTSEAINTKINEKTLKIQAYLERIPKSQDSQLIELYEKEIGKLKKEIEELQERLIPNPYTSNGFGTALTKVIDTIKNPVTVWENGDLETKFAIFHMYFDTKIPYQRGKGFGTASLAYPIKLMHDISVSKDPLVEMGSNELPSEKVNQKHLQAYSIVKISSFCIPTENQQKE